MRPTDRIRLIEQRRRAKGIGRSRLCERAGVDWWTWERLRGGGPLRSRDALLERLERALDTIPPRTDPVLTTAILALMRLAARAVLAEAAALPAVIEELTVVRQRAVPATAIAQARLQRVAIYLVAVELEIPNAAIARALGMSRQNVQQARLAIEQLRDKPAVDAMLERCRAVLTS